LAVSSGAANFLSGQDVSSAGGLMSSRALIAGNDLITRFRLVIALR
jgi:hypothetical protein